jgi:hypothetical protein
MNKAFVREPEPGAEHCPQCGSIGTPVPRELVSSRLKTGETCLLAVTANFCPGPQCEVAYFDMFERVVPITALNAPVFPKDPQAPICECFQFTTAEIDLDIAEGGVQRTKALLEKAKSSSAQCARLSASGRSCVADVQRYYMQHRNG